MAQLDPASDIPSALSEERDLPFPASTKQAAGMVGGLMTDVMSISFADKILFTITQKGRLAHWLHVPLEDTSPEAEAPILTQEGDDSLLPASRLTATTLLGGRSEEWETIGHLYACQVANAIVTKNPAENRLLVLGLGLDKPILDREIFFATIDLALQCI